jgi:glycosyltransferase involved in cell wall biosynthesis
LPNFVFKSAERYAAKYTTHFITVANAMTEQYLAAGIGEPARYTRIFSGFNLQPFLEAKNDPLLRTRLGIDKSDVVVGKIARLFELKGHDDLFAIAAQLVARCPSVKFLFVGDGKWRARFESRAKELGLVDHFIFTGLVPPDDVAQYVGIMDIVVHLSRREGLPRALPQALAAGKPVVAYDCDGAREVCFDGETGCLISPGDLTTLTRRLLELAADRSLRNRLGSKGQQFVRDHFSVERMVQNIHDLYGRLLNGRKP